MNSTRVVNVEDLYIHIEQGDSTVRAVDGVTLHLDQGEILALVGESGSGKTLTARSLLGLVPKGAQTRGQVLVKGADVLAANKSRLRDIRGKRVAMVFQEPSTALNPVYTVGWQIEEGLRAHGVSNPKDRRKRAIAALQDVGIPEPETRVNDYPHQFSGGQKQRVVIAAALALKPDVIVADEPTTALDVTVQAEILALLRKCRDELGTSIVVITHNMGVVADLADRVAVMYQGKIVESADVHEIFGAPRHEYTQRLLASVPRFGNAVRSRDTGDNDATERVLTAHKLDVHYRGRFGRPGHHAVRDVSFDIRKGEIFGLVGESGSGKSTLGRTIAGLTKSSSGELELLGTDVRNASHKAMRELRRRVGFIFQDPASSFNPFMSVSDCITEPLRIHEGKKAKKTVRKKVVELLDAVQLPRSFAERTPVELSGGQRQRVGLARALILDPEFVIADEPTSALDVSVQARVLELLSDLHQEYGFAALFITHDLAVVEAFADRVGVLKKGRFVEIAAADELLTNAFDPYTKALIEAVPVPEPAEQRRKREVSLNR